MISLTNYDFQWARSELVIIYPEISAVQFSLRHRFAPDDLKRPKKPHSSMRQRLGGHQQTNRGGW